MRHGLPVLDTYLLAPEVGVGWDGRGDTGPGPCLLLSTRRGKNLGSHLHLPLLGEALAK